MKKLILLALILVVPILGWCKAGEFTDSEIDGIVNGDDNYIDILLQNAEYELTDSTQLDGKALMHKAAMAMRQDAGTVAMQHHALWQFGHSRLANKVEFLLACKWLHQETTSDVYMKVERECLKSFVEGGFNEKWRPIMLKALDKAAEK